MNAAATHGEPANDRAGSACSNRYAERTSGKKRRSTEAASPMMGEKLVSDIARRVCKPNAARLAPSRLIDFFLVADFQRARRFSGEKNCIAHFSPGAAVFGVHLFPKADTSEPELW